MVLGRHHSFHTIGRLSGAWRGGEAQLAEAKATRTNCFLSRSTQWKSKEEKRKATLAFSLCLSRGSMQFVQRICSVASRLLVGKSSITHRTCDILLCTACVCRHDLRGKLKKKLMFYHDS